MKNVQSIVVDQNVIPEFVASELSSQGFEFARDVRSALRILRYPHKYEVIVLASSGDVTSALRAFQDEVSSMPVVVVVPFYSQEVAAKIIESGVNDVVPLCDGSRGIVKAVIHAASRKRSKYCFPASRNLECLEALVMGRSIG